MLHTSLIRRKRTSSMLNRDRLVLLLLLLAVISFEGIQMRVSASEARRSPGSSDSIPTRLTKIRQELNSLKSASMLFTQRAEELWEEMALLKDEDENQQDPSEALADRIDYLEAITRKDVPRTCQDLRDLGITESGGYLIDPDGAGIGDAPIAVVCEMTGGMGATKVPHDTMRPTDIDHCEEPGCHSSRVSYESTGKQMRALMDLSAECTQSIQYVCFDVPLMRNEENMAWWTGDSGVRNFYWDDDHDPDAHACACDAEGTCVDGRYRCNCDSGAPEWLMDAGVLSNKEALPVTELRFGGLLFDGQAAKFHLGPLICQGKRELEPTKSCEALLTSGNTATGYYVVDSPDGETHSLVKCNMNLEPSHSEFQVPTSVKTAQSPVAFDFRRRTAYTTNTTVVPYEEALLNHGGAMAKTGVFRAPVDGVYAFHFGFAEIGTGSGVLESTLVQLRINGGTVAASTFKFAAHDEDSGTSWENVIVELGRGQEVDVYLSSGGISANADTHFAGYLVRPL